MGQDHQKVKALLFITKLQTTRFPLAGAKQRWMSKSSVLIGTFVKVRYFLYFGPIFLTKDRSLRPCPICLPIQRNKRADKKAEEEEHKSCTEGKKSVNNAMLPFSECLRNAQVFRSSRPSQTTDLIVLDYSDSSDIKICN